MGGSNLIAIITRTKNRPLLLKRAIESVQAQTYTNYLHIIINDGGNQEEIQNLLMSVLGESWAARCVVQTIDSNGRMEVATNEAILIAQDREADLAVILDDDDSWSPEFLSIMLRELRSYEKLVPTVKGIVCRSNQVHEKIEGNIITVDHLEIHAPHIPELGLLKFADLLDHMHNFGDNQFLYRLEVINTIGMYNPDFPVLGDWEFNLRFLQHFDIALIPNFLAFYHRRIGAQGSDVNSGSGEVLRKIQWEVYQQVIQNKYLREGSAVGALMNFPTNQIFSQLKELQKQISELEKRMPPCEEKSQS